MKLKRIKTWNCGQGKMHGKESSKKTGWSQETWRGFAGTPREKKIDYVMESYKKTCETLLSLFFGTIVF